MVQYKQLLQRFAKYLRQREKSLEEVRDTKETRERKDNHRGETKTAAYAIQKPNNKRCYACSKRTYCEEVLVPRERQRHKMEPNQTNEEIPKSRGQKTSNGENRRIIS